MLIGHGRVNVKQTAISRIMLIMDIVAGLNKPILSRFGRSHLVTFFSLPLYHHINI